MPTSSRARQSFRILAGVAGALMLGSCASSGTMSTARRAEAAEDYDVAVAEYTKAVHDHPKDTAALAALDRVRLLASERHFLRGRQLAGAGRDDDALVELEIASELAPGNADIEAELRTVRTALRNKLSVDQHGQTALETLLSSARNITSPGPDIPDLSLPSGISMGPQTPSRDAYLMLGLLGNLNVAFDQSFVDAPASVSFKPNMKLRDALDTVALATNTFYRVTAPGTITVIPNTPVKQREYLEEWTATFYVQNVDLNEAIEVLKTVADVRSIAKISATNAISIRDTRDRLEAVGKLLQAIDKARPEVIVDVEILEVDRSRLQEYGLQFASAASASTGTMSPGIDAAATINPTTVPNLNSLRSLTSSDVLMTGVPSLYYRLLKTDANTRILANPHMRASDGIAAEEKFGQQVPVPNATFAPIAQGGVNQQAITSYTYQNVGVSIDITPRTHADDEVTLAVKVVLSDQGANGYAGLPSFGNREISTTIRLKDGETSILAGLIRDDERSELDGLPGVSDLPLIGRLFAKNHHEKEQTDVILALTPHIIRVLDVSPDDLKPFLIKRDASAGGGGGG